MIKVGIIGATGYTGIELIRILSQHPQTKITYLSSQTFAGQMLAEVYPHLQHLTDLSCKPINTQEIQKICDLVFIALPHGQAIKLVPELLDFGLKIIDLGPDLRLKNTSDYTKWYQAEAAPEELLAKAIYGLPEAGLRQQIKTASLIANPGCYATAAILTALPVINKQLVDINDCIFDGKSGISGAGRTLSVPNLFCEATANIKAYQIAGKHRHTPEIEQALSSTLNQKIAVQFTPHVTAMSRGLFMTSYFKLTQTITPEEIHSIYQNFYHEEPFIRICSSEQSVQTKQVCGTNFCHMTLEIDPRCQRLTVLAAIDNLVKGAAGQAVQNMNLMSGIAETMGLGNLHSLYI